MGNASWSTTDWATHASATSTKTREEIFKSRDIKDSLNPAKFSYREARDSAANPQSTPIILASDVTGSMGITAEVIIKEHLGKIMKSLYDHKPVSDPAICCMAIGDMTIDRAPIQATQFESDIRLAEQMSDFYIEGGGGGNGGESYSLAWLFALGKVKADIHKKRHRKGYIFTIGDECNLPTMDKNGIKTFLNLDAPESMSSEHLLRQVEKDWEIFHLIINPVNAQPVIPEWRRLLGERAIVLPNLDHIADGITAIIDTLNGHSADEVATRYGSSTELIIRPLSTKLVKT